MIELAQLLLAWLGLVRGAVPAIEAVLLPLDEALAPALATCARCIAWLLAAALVSGLARRRRH